MLETITIKDVEMTIEEYETIMSDIVSKEPEKLQYVKYPTRKIIESAVAAGGIKVIEYLKI